MGSCIICGRSVDGYVCTSHEEDVAFEFRGDQPDQLVPGRYYHGTVDGYADFGVFVTIGKRVTGLLHRSELDQRLESLTWEPGDEVYVQVTNVRDNGNIDLAWSIRQAAEEFRGRLIHDPSAGGQTVQLPADDEESADESSDASATSEASTSGNDDAAGSGATGGGATDATGAETGRGGGSRDSTSDDGADAAAERDDAESADARSDDAGDDHRDAETSEPDETPEAEDEEPPEPDDELARTPVGDLADLVGERVRIEGDVESIHQTGGPTVFEVGDESGTVDCAAFVAPGERAYPEVEVEDVVALVGEVERRHGDIQVETESLAVLDEEATREVRERVAAALTERARPNSTALLAESGPASVVADAIAQAATEIRRAVFESRPVVIRHPATLDGYVAGAAIERAVVPLVRAEQGDADAEYHGIERRPLEDPHYDMGAATDDVSSMLADAERHGEPTPLFVLAGLGCTRESLDGLSLLDVYDAGRVVIDAGEADEGVAEAADVLVSPQDDAATASEVAANVAAMVNDDVREDVRHLPSVGAWEDASGTLRDLAAEAGYEPDDVQALREAIGLVAYYQTYNPKRELVADLLWDADDGSLVEHVSAQFRQKLRDELDTVEPHLDRRGADAVRVTVLDVDAFTHRFEFPPATIVLEAVHRQERETHDGEQVTVAVDEDDLRLRSTSPVDVREVAETVAERHEAAGVRARGPRDGHLEFLRGERDAVIDSVVEVVRERVGAGENESEARVGAGEQ